MGKVSSLGEFQLINLLCKKLNHGEGVLLGPGDDTAILELPPQDILVTCDVQIEGIHFDMEYFSFEQIGWKSLAVNISDIAAMGGVPKFALISLVIPESAEVSNIDALYKGLNYCADTYNVSIVGGNISKSPAGIQVDITIIGVAEKGKAVKRSGAQAGDSILVTSFPGLSSSCLRMLHSGFIKENIPEDMLKAHLEPQPRVDIGLFLSENCYATSMIDISDGLAADLNHICESSNVGAVLDTSSFPVHEDLKNSAENLSKNWMDFFLHGGEDYELLFTVPSKIEDKVLSGLKAVSELKITKIGRITSERQLLIQSPGSSLSNLSVSGWDHLSG